MLASLEESLFKEYESTGSADVATSLLKSLDTARRQWWVKTMEQLDFTYSSRKAWHLLRHLGAAAPVQHTTPKVTPNAIATRLLSTSKAKPTRNIDLSLKTTKDSKAEGVDGIFLNSWRTLVLLLEPGWHLCLHIATPLESFHQFGEKQKPLRSWNHGSLLTDQKVIVPYRFCVQHTNCLKDYFSIELAH